MNGTLQLDSSDRVIAKAWADEDFRAALMADPRAALAAEGIELPEGVTLNVVENSEQVLNLVLPQKPDFALAGEMLDSAAGAARCGGCGGGGRCGGACGCGGSCRCGCICVCV